MDVHPALLRDTQSARFAGTGEHHRRALIDLLTGDHQPAIGLGNQAIALGQRGELLGSESTWRSGMRIGRGDPGEGCEKLADLQPVVAQAQPQPLTPDVFGESIAADRRADPVAQRGGIDHALITGAAILDRAFVAL
jgi:hypothetical protein